MRRNVKQIVGWGSVAVLVGTILLPVAFAERPGRGGGGKGGGKGGFDREAMQKRMQAMRAADTYFNALVFEIKISDQKLIKVRPDFQAHFDTRKKAGETMRKEMEKSQDFRKAGEKYGKAIEAANKKLEAALKKKLSDAEYKKMKELAAAQSRGFGGFGGRGGRGGRGGGRPGG